MNPSSATGATEPIIASPQFLGALYDRLAHTPYLPGAVYVLILLAAFAAAALWASGRLRDGALDLALVGLPFLACLPFVAFTDEVFTSLLQVRNLVELGRYSFDTGATTDASVSVLFYLLVAALAVVGVPIPIGAWLLGILCLGLSAVVLRRILTSLGIAPVLVAPIAVAAALSPFMLMAAFSGFEASLAGLLTLLALGALLRSRYWAAAGCLALLAFTRFDLAFVAAAAAGLALLAARLRPRALPLLAPLLAPLAMVGAWWAYYGHPVPTPMVAKSGGLSPAFAPVGVLELAEYLGRNPALLALPALALIVWRSGRLGGLRPYAAPLLALLLPVGLYSAMILWGGGDYLSPVVGNRYLQPLHLLLLVCLALLGQQLMPAAGEAPRRPPLSAPLAVAALLLALLGPAAVERTLLVTTEFNQRRFGDYGRVENYGAAASLLNTYMPHEVTLASTEISTLFYYWRGQYLPLFATANRDIAAGGVRTGDLTFKKVSPEPMRRTRPELAFWDATRTHTLPSVYRMLSAEIELASERGAGEREITALAVAKLFPMQEANLDGDLLRSEYRFRILQRGDLAVFLFVHERFVDEFDRLVGRNVVARVGD